MEEALMYKQSNNWLMILKEKEVKKQELNKGYIMNEEITKVEDEKTSIIPKGFAIPDFSLPVFPAL